MFPIEVKRVIAMIAEAIHPTENVDEHFNGRVYQFGKNNRYFSLYYNKETKRPTACTNDLFSARYDLNDKNNVIKFILKIWGKREAPNGMDSVEAHMEACYCPPFGDASKTIIISKQESIVPDVKFLEEMYMDDMEKVSVFIVKSARRLINVLQQRVDSQKRYDESINKK